MPTLRDTPLLVLALVAIACGGTDAVRAPAPAEPAAPAETVAQEPAAAELARLEDRLAGAAAIEITAHITAQGLIQAELDGTLLVDDDDTLLGFEGTFRDAEVELSLQSNGRVMTGGNRDLTFSQDAPPALQEGLVIGLTRMGLLHNLAVLASGNPPQGTYGGVRDWVTVRDVVRNDDHLELEIDVDGKPSASAKLWLDPATGLPARREQTVRFEAGEMRVVEVYETFTARPRGRSSAGP